MKWTCCYYSSDSGRVPVEKFIDSLASRTQQKFFAVVGMLENLGKKLPEPHAKSLGNGIYELRFKGQEGHIRILHFFMMIKRLFLQMDLLRSLIRRQRKKSH